MIESNSPSFFTFASISEAVWYWLAGNLTISVSQNYILNSGCQSSAATMKKRHEEYIKTVKKYDETHGHPLSKKDTTKKVSSSSLF